MCIRDRVEAAKKAQCMEFLEKLPQGIHSMAGDAGKMLSGGQRPVSYTHLDVYKRQGLCRFVGAAV